MAANHAGWRSTDASWPVSDSRYCCAGALPEVHASGRFVCGVLQLQHGFICMSLEGKTWEQHVAPVLLLAESTADGQVSSVFPTWDASLTSL